MAKRSNTNKGNITSKKYNIEDAVFKSFIRVMKDRDLFPLYLRQTGIKGIVRHILQRGVKIQPYNTADNPFSVLTSTDSIIEMLYKISIKMFKSQSVNLNDVDRYEHVTMTINHLLHFFVENKAKNVSMDDLVSIGEEIYARSCNVLFGDSIDDLEQQRIEDEKRRKEREANQLAEMERLMGKKGKNLGKRSDENDWGSGIALGNVPNDGNMFMDGLNHNEGGGRINPHWISNDDWDEDWV